MNLHKLYLSLFAGLCLVSVIAGAAWRDHIRDDARRDAVLETEKSDVAGIQQRIATARNEALEEMKEFERQRKSLPAAPARAPDVIRQLVPMQLPIQQIAPLTPQSPPDAPSAQLSKQQEIELAQYALACKECSLQRDQLGQQVKDQQEIVSRQTVEIEATKNSAKGGSVWQRTVRIAKWGAIFGGLGYAMGRAQR
jgi:hypothetical protein